MSSRIRVLHRASAGRLFLGVCGVVVACDALVLLVRAQLPPLPPWGGVLLDAALLIGVLFPVLYLLVAFPPGTHIAPGREAEPELVESELRDRTVLETMSLIGVMLDRTGKITLCNDYLLALTGWTRNEVMGKNWFRVFVPPEIRDGIENEIFLKAIADGEIQARFENEIVTRAGERRLVRWSNTLLWDPDGSVTGVASIGEDITERQRTELERQVMHEVAQGVATTSNLDDLLKLIHQSLLRVLDAENCFVALHDPETGLFSFPYFADQYDSVPAPVAMAKSCTAYVFRRGEPALITPAVFKQLQEQDEVALVGSPSPSWMGVPLRTPSRTIGVLVLQHYEKEDRYSERDLRFLADVGSQAAVVIERKQAEVALRDSEAELKVILESTADGILAVDGKGKVIRANRRFAEMWRLPQALVDSGDDDALLRHVLSQLVNPEDFLAKVQLLYGSADESTDTLHFKDGRVFERQSSPIIMDERIVGRVWSFHDITARRQAEAATAALESQLHQSQKMESVGLLAGGVAHEFNNMLAVILGNTEFALKEVDPTQPIHADLQAVHKAARRSADLTQQLLAFARRQHVAPRMLDLNETVPTTLSMLQPLLGEDIDVVWQPAERLWPVTMDASQLDQIVTNLCANARAAIADVGTLTIATTNCVVDAAFCDLHADAVPGEYVRLTVRDSGSGMDEATVGRIFEPFFTTKGVGKGTGLGLAMVYGAVRQNHGFLTVSSATGQGTTFEIYLPRHVGDATTERTSGGVRLPAVGWETVLLVEDEPSILRLTTRVLAAQGYNVLGARSPADAIRLATEHPGEIHLLLSDVVLPEMNGRDLADALAALRPNLKQLFMSGHAADVIASRGILTQGASFIEKPFSAGDLAVKVREVLDLV